MTLTKDRKDVGGLSSLFLTFNIFPKRISINLDSWWVKLEAEDCGILNETQIWLQDELLLVKLMPNERKMIIALHLK